MSIIRGVLCAFLIAIMSTMTISCGSDGGSGGTDTGGTSDTGGKSDNGSMTDTGSTTDTGGTTDIGIANDPGSCTPDCSLAGCGDDDGCGGKCTACPANSTCNSTTWVCDCPGGWCGENCCLPNKPCGDDGTCQNLCGNGVLDEGEFCEPSLEPQKDCRDVSGLYVSGVASCTSDCHWDLGECEEFKAVCGNGLIEPGEQCEQGLNDTASCPSISYQFVDGVATCTSDCKFDTSACTITPSTCGDGILEGIEQCDEGNANGSDTCSIDCVALQNGQPVNFEPPDHNGNTFGLPEAFMANWICTDPKVRNGWRNQTVVEVGYDIYICSVGGTPVMNLADIQATLADMATAFAPAHINLVELNNSTFSWNNCVVNYDTERTNYLKYMNGIITNDHVLSVVVMDQITGGSGNILGFSGPVWPITVTSLSKFTIAHEIGHKFALSHTHECLGGALETSATCLTAGDQICDTPPDPGPYWLQNGYCGGYCNCNGCPGTGTCTDSSAPDCSNMMAYYHCWGDFSNEQLDFMRCTLENEMSYFKLNCTSTAEVCNNKDDNCNGQIDENLTRSCGTDVGDCKSGTQTCSNGKWGACSGASGGNTEICDDKDNDCDGSTDEGLKQECGSDTGECKKGKQDCVGGSWDTPCLGGVNPKPEICDNRDNDCDGSTDESLSETCGTDEGECTIGVDCHTFFPESDIGVLTGNRV